MSTVELEAAKLECVRGGRRLFANVSFSLSPGTLLQITGTNGSGKTSLLRIICGLMAPESGEVRWQGANIRSLGEEYSSSIAYLGHRNGIKEELSSLENLRISAGLAGFELSHEEARNALKQVGLAGRENLPTRFLSEGQKRRSALARLVTCNTRLWVLDEVLASLDAAAVRLVESMIKEHLSKEGIAIVATHQELKLSGGSFQRLVLETEAPSSTGALGSQA
ncbi:MAG: cytochrome c biogenesis heme-transporting ATPase CcmA [bacterium]